jgi:hypothetical protein
MLSLSSSEYGVEMLFGWDVRVSLDREYESVCLRGVGTQSTRRMPPFCEEYRTILYDGLCDDLFLSKHCIDPGGM